MITINDRNFKEIISREEIKRVVYNMANHIDSSYSADDELVFIGILNGAFIFLSDLVRAVNHNAKITFTHIKSYHGMERSDELEIIKDIDINIDGKHVILVEDIIDSGSTILQYHQILRLKNPQSIAIYALLMKPESIVHEIPSFQVGFEISDNFVIGYGLDFNGLGRNLEGIFQLVDEES